MIIFLLVFSLLIVCWDLIFVTFSFKGHISADSTHLTFSRLLQSHLSMLPSERVER